MTRCRLFLEGGGVEISAEDESENRSGKWGGERGKGTGHRVGEGSGSQDRRGRGKTGEGEGEEWG